MNVDALLQKAELLYHQSRFADAEDLARKALGLEPENWDAKMILALSLSEQEKHDEALETARMLVAQVPDFPHCYFVLGKILCEKGEIKQAEDAARQALNLDPEDADYWHLLSMIQGEQKNWKQALESVEKGLECDPEHFPCSHMRSLVLTQLGQKEEASQSTRANLAKDPDNAFAHASMGWTLLHQNKPKEAVPHFREALRLKPDLEWARDGVLEALRARNIVYRQILKYFLWMGRQKAATQWFVIIGLYVLIRIIRNLGQTYPQLTVLSTILVFAYLGFVFLSWAGPALFNLMLRLHPFGKLALSRTERIVSNVVGGLVLLTVGSIAVGIWLDYLSLILFGLVSLAMIIPVAGTWGLPANKRRTLLIAYTLILGMLGITGSVLVALVETPGYICLGFFLLGCVLYGWIANIAMMKT